MGISGWPQRTLLSALIVLAAFSTSTAFAQKKLTDEQKACSSNDSGLKLIHGFCATVFADKLGHPRHMVVAPNGVVYVNTWSGVYYGNDKPPAGGFLVALQDTTGSGKANVVKRFGATVKIGGAGGTGIALYKGDLYVEINDRIVRYKMSPGQIVPTGKPEVIVSGMPLGGDHPMHPVRDRCGRLDVCGHGHRHQRVPAGEPQPGSPGINPCTETQTRGGIWRFDANKAGQKFSPAERYATGIRNADGIVDRCDRSRRVCHSTWPRSALGELAGSVQARAGCDIAGGGADQGREGRRLRLAGVLLRRGAEEARARVRSTAATAARRSASAPARSRRSRPSRRIGRPDDLLLYDGKEFPERFRGGAFIAFHGSWNRAPFPQAGYNVTFQPLKDGKENGRCEIFADGFAGPGKSTGKALHRPTGLAVGPEGALYVSDDARGRIYRITYIGSPNGDAHGAPCPAPDASPGKKLAAAAAPPEGLKKDAGTADLAGPSRCDA